jgi:hypothetical protein
VKTKAFITVILVLLMKFGDAQSWIYVTSTVDSAKIYVRVSPTYLPHGIKVWVKTTEGKIRRDENGAQVIPSGATISLIEFDCFNLKYRIYSLGDLDSNGNIVNNIELDGNKASWYDIIPNSAYEKVLRKACESSNLR